MRIKIRVGLLFGGKSAEHEVSLQSAQSVLKALDKDKYEPVLIGIDKTGRWHLNQASSFLLNPDDPAQIQLNESAEVVSMVPWDRAEEQLMRLPHGQEVEPVDVVFPVLHGPLGEDGTVQGLLKLAGVPFVGSGVLGSAVAMDKDFAKRLLRDAGLPVAAWVLLSPGKSADHDFEQLVASLKLPFFIKPANLGSSVGVHKVGNEQQFRSAVRDAFKYDRKVLAEEFIEGREIECSVLGNEDPIASVLGEIVPQHEFYSYEAKYLDENGALLKVPADLPEKVTEEIRRLAVEAFVALGCEGLSRVDFFYSEQKGVVINEINTIPGFTRISMYPRLWEATGVSYPDLIDQLISLALERHQHEKQLKSDRN